MNPTNRFELIPRKRIILPILAAATLSLASTASAQTQVFFENFDADHSLDNTWITNTIGGYNPVNLYFDYSSVGIPAAPHSTNGTTRGLKLQANLDPLVGVFPSGCSVSPAGFSITSNFEMRWDWWLNFNGSPTTGLTGGGNGSTQIGGAGFGTAATSANVPTLIDSVFVGCSGDGSGTTADYRVYTPSFSASLQDASGVYAAGTSGSRNNTHPYYQTTFPPVSATNTAPNQLALYPGTQFGLTQGGSAGMKWHDISLKKVANIITYSIDGLLIATIDISTNGTLGGNNILFGQFDINAGASTDVLATNLAFSLVDNVTITNFTNVVSVSATTTPALEAGPTPGVFTMFRSDSSKVLTVNYTLTGTATNGVDYVTLPGSVTFPIGVTETNITVTPIDDGISEFTETVILKITPALEFTGSGNATMEILDNDAQELVITNISTQMYERTNDFAIFRVSRKGDISAGTYDINLSMSGTATSNVDYYVDSPLSLDSQQTSKDIKVYPIQDSDYEGNETVTMSLAPATGGAYAIGSPASSTITLVDANTAPETVLFSENFNTDTSANWSVLATEGDYTATFAYDYSGSGIPPAPHGSGDTLGLFLTANKADATGSAAAVNVYPNGQTFSGNYALRFDMFISVVVPNAVSTEYVLFGVNHSGTKTNWFRGSPGGVPAGWTFDGVFYSIEADGAGLGDYINYSSPTTNNNPTALTTSTLATNFTEIFKSPPNSVPGVPGNNTTLGSPTPIWADVELSQIGRIQTLKINQKVIFSYSNTTAYASGNIMLGYDDSFDSIGLASSYVIIDNVRVVRLNGMKITSVQSVGANIQLDFTYDLNDSPASFKVQTASVVTGPYADATATIVQVSPGVYRATIAKSGNVQLYRIRHL